MNGSEKNERDTRSAAWLLLACLAVLVAGLLLGPALLVYENVHWLADEVEVRQPSGSSKTTRINDISAAAGERIELRKTITIDTSEHWSRPVGVLLSGPFSAAIYWDGDLIGAKGEIGSGGEPDIAGPIDSLSFLPSAALRAGGHELRILLSTGKLNYQSNRLVHTLALAPYRDDQRRSLRYYATPLLLLGGLVLLLLLNIRAALGKERRIHVILAVFAGFTVVALLAEISRAVVNYPYDFHVYRSMTTWAAVVGAGFCLSAFTAAQVEARWVNGLLAVGIVAFAFNQFDRVGGDRQIVQDFMILSAAPALIFAIRSVRGSFGYLAILPMVWLAALISQRLSYSLFLDVYLYLAAMVFLGGTWFGLQSQPKKPDAMETEVPGRKRLAVKVSGREIVLDCDQVQFMRAAGNYTEVHTLDGGEYLHNERLGAMTKDTPDGFLRVHRSNTVNMRHVKALRSAEGSSYWLELKDGTEVSVSRNQVAAIRGWINS